MKKRFVVLLESATPQQDEEFRKWVDEQSFGYWHWLGQSWLLVDRVKNSDAHAIRDKAIVIYDDINLIVLDVTAQSQGKWAGFGPQSEESDMFKWFHENWDS